MSLHTPASQARSTAAIRALETATVAREITPPMLIQAACPTWHRMILAATPTRHRPDPPQQPTTSLDTPASRIRTPTEPMHMRTRQRAIIA